MFATTSPKPIDELEVDQSSYDEGIDDGIDDDATEFSQRSWQPYNILPPYKGSSVSGPGGTIRMEGWLNHTTSSYKDNNATQHQSNNDVTNTAPPASTTTQSIISKTISTKKKKKARQNSKKQRYFVLRNTTLSYYARRHDVKAKGTFVLTKGCTVGPVVYASLDESLIEIGGNATISTTGQQEPLSPTTRDINAATGTDSTTNTNTKSSKKQKKQENQLYCIQITWPTNDQPTKDEKFMAQAKAQVAAESEKAEALQQQQLELDNSFDTDRLGDGGTKSPLAKPKQLMRRVSQF